MNCSPNMTRRSALALLATTAAAMAGAKHLLAEEKPAAKLKGRIRHSISPGVLRKMPLEERCVICKEIGIEGMDLLGPKDWPTLKKHGLVCAMASGAGMGIAKGFNHVEHHDKLVESFTEAIPQVADAGWTNLICFSGNREGISDEQGLANCVTGLKRILKLAEDKKVTLCMELLNSKRSHKDYQCDHTAWGVELCKKLGSDRFKLLYDIYHMQLMEGDIIATIRENIRYIAHFHTAGVPGRNEIDETQELNYPAICRAIAATGFKGFVGQEYGPTRDPVTALRQAISLCDV